MARPLKPQNNVLRGDPIGGFDKLTVYIDFHMTDLNHPLGIEYVLTFYLGSDIDNKCAETMKERRYQLKPKLLSCYRVKILALQACDAVPI